MYDTEPNPTLRKTTQAGDQYNPNLRNKSDRSANPYVTDKHVFKTLSDFHQNFSSVHSINYLRQTWTLEDSVVQSFFAGCNSIATKAGLFISPPSYWSDHVYNPASLARKPDEKSIELAGRMLSHVGDRSKGKQRSLRNDAK